MSTEFRQIVWDGRLRADWEQLLRLAVREDLAEDGDWTTRALVPEDALGRAAVVARQPGIVAGLPGVERTLQEIDPRLRWLPETEDGQSVRPGDRIGQIEGPARGLLTAERLVLNLLGRLSGIATLTRKYVEAVATTTTRIYDTRKTTPGLRMIEKYAVTMGGAKNHRIGLFDAVLIKDNHVALAGGIAPTIARARAGTDLLIEVECDTLDQAREAVEGGADMLLLDNMDPDMLREAVTMIDGRIPLEASGGINLTTIRPIAETGVDYISVGRITQSAPAMDIGMDFEAAG